MIQWVAGDGRACFQGILRMSTTYDRGIPIRIGCFRRHRGSGYRRGLVYFLLDVVTPSTCRRSPPGTNREVAGFAVPSASDGDLVAVRLLRATYSSRRIQKLCERDAAYRVIVAMTCRTSARSATFARTICDPLQGLFVQVTDVKAVRGRSAEGRLGVTGRHEGRSQRLPAQSDELRIPAEGVSSG